MIKFFRNFREQMITDNKTSKYLLYAIGEIVLVVIGILIALQINNWNENRKLEVQELNFLKSFKVSLQADSTDRVQSIELHERARNSMDILIDHMENDLPYRDTLKYHFSNMMTDWGLPYDFSTYEALKSNDLNLITNETLRSSIIDYYSYAEGSGTILKNRYTEVIENASRTILSKHFDQMWNARITAGGVYGLEGVMVPNDFEALKQDQQFRYFLKTLRNQNYWLVQNPLTYSSENFARISEVLYKEIARLED